MLWAAALLVGSAIGATEPSGPLLVSPWSPDEPPAPAAVPAAIAPEAENATPLALAAPPRERSEQMEQIARQADRHTRHGYELAGRGAYFAARAEFLAALKLVAEGRDTEQRTDRHGRALAAARTALREAEDFLPSPARMEAETDPAIAIASHETPVLQGRAAGVTSLTAMKCYLTFAQQQFALASGGEVAGSMALHALGKLNAALARAKSGLVPAADAKAMTFYQAAMLVYPENFLAANDLGVLLAQNGDWAAARVMLERGAAGQPCSIAWRNLAVVYRQLGNVPAARQAELQAAAFERAEIARRKQATGTAAAVQWLDPQSFAQTSLNTPASPGAWASPLNAPDAMPATNSKRPSTAERMSWGKSNQQR